MHLVGCKWLPAFYIANGMGLGIGNVGYWKLFTLNVLENLEHSEMERNGKAVNYAVESRATQD